MMEHWKDIKGFVGYQVSDHGRVRSFWKKKHYPKGYGTYRVLGDEPKIMSASDDGNGYLKLMLYCVETGKRYCRKVHRLVAEAFIPNDDPSLTVDHIRPGNNQKKNNKVSNLQWIPRRENIQKAYREGVCNERIRKQNKPIMTTDIWTGDEFYFNSINEAANKLGIDRASISHVLIGDYKKTSHYTFEYASREERLLYGD